MAEAGAKGDELGRVYTPEPVARAIMERVAPLLPPGPVSVVDPCLGGGAIIDAARVALGNRVSLTCGWDVDPEAPARRRVDMFAIRDARVPPMLRRPFTLAATNPPWGKAVTRRVTLEIVQAMARYASTRVVIVPVEYLAQRGWARLVDDADHVWPIEGRVWTQERGIVVMVWRHQRMAAPEFSRLTIPGLRPV